MRQYQQSDRNELLEEGNDIEQDVSFLEKWYAKIENQFDVVLPGNGELRHLCNTQQNQSIPIYSWFNLKEAFSFDFPLWVVAYLEKEFGYHTECVLDPFIGGGTTSISLSSKDITITGVEYNPFIAWVAQVKSHWWAYDPQEIARAIGKFTFKPPAGGRFDWPELTTFHNRKYFRSDDIRIFLHILTQIDSSETSDLTRHFLRLGVASSIDDIANLRKDGRALRYIKKKGRPTAQTALINRWQYNLKGLEESLKHVNYTGSNTSSVWRGSAVNLSGLRNPWEDDTQASLASSSFDLVLYSPPYLNNFDYSEIYKLELWLLGFLKTYEQWQKLRQGTIRSHHSVKFQATSHLADNPNTAEIASQLDAMGRSACLSGYARENMPPVILGYFDDMSLALKEQFRVLKPGGYLAYMVANSRHANLPIATDLIIGEIARLIGFTPLLLNVLNKRNGRTRQKNYL